MSENVGKTGKTEKQCVGENGRFRTFFGSMDDHIVPKTESVFSQRSQCFLRVFDYYDNVLHLFCSPFLFRFLVFFCVISTFSSPLFSCPALPSPTHAHAHTHNRQHTTDTTHLLDAHLGGCGVCFRPSHRGRRLFGWDVSEGDCSVRVTFTTMTMTAHCWCFHGAPATDRYLASGLSKWWTLSGKGKNQWKHRSFPLDSWSWTASSGKRHLIRLNRKPCCSRPVLKLWNV